MTIANRRALLALVAGAALIAINTTSFTTPQGVIKVNLPDDMAAGDTISGTVTAEPTGILLFHP